MDTTKILDVTFFSYFFGIMLEIIMYVSLKNAVCKVHNMAGVRRQLYISTIISALVVENASFGKKSLTAFYSVVTDDCTISSLTICFE